MRTAARIDVNQPEIVQALRNIGASVDPIHTLGKGRPDLMVGFRGLTFLLEVKDGDKAPSRQKLTDDEAKWHAYWRGHVAVVTDIESALHAIGALATPTENPHA
ncbi:MAG: hypothetical protein ACRC1H_13795 [Caldilineaceae bacterium]